MTGHEDFLKKILLEKSMIICGGSGGVGKTTTAAVLALQAAIMGRKALVLTIDPAKRLANSLGLDELGNQIKQVDSKHLQEAGIQITGQLHAMMLDCKRTFDDLIHRYTTSKEQAEKILNNRYYQHLSNALTGSHEYMAMEKLYEIHVERQFDLIVLDTPPTHNALDFLDAPNRMDNLLDDSVLKWFIKPYFAAGKFSFKAAKKGSKIIFKILQKITGMDLLRDLSEFFLSFHDMFGGFRERAQKVREVLKDKHSCFLLITSPNRLTIEEAIFYHDKLQELNLPFGGFLINKVHNDYAIAPDTSSADLVHEMKKEIPDSKGHPEDLKNLAENLKNFQALYELDRKSIDQLKEKTHVPESQIRRVRYFDEDIFALEELKMMMSEIFAVS
jgi:anion-transporting  ArsA/GET3 family ATPase